MGEEGREVRSGRDRGGAVRERRRLIWRMLIDTLIGMLVANQLLTHSRNSLSLLMQQRINIGLSCQEATPQTRLNAAQLEDDTQPSCSNHGFVTTVISAHAQYTLVLIFAIYDNSTIVFVVCVVGPVYSLVYESSLV